jgi:hypothetical protein
MFRALPAAIFDADELKNLANPGTGMLSPPETATNADGTDRRDANGFLIRRQRPRMKSTMKNFWNSGGLRIWANSSTTTLHSILRAVLRSLTILMRLSFSPGARLDNVYGRGPADQPYLFEAGYTLPSARVSHATANPPAQDLLRS